MTRKEKNLHTHDPQSFLCKLFHGQGALRYSPIWKQIFNKLISVFNFLYNMQSIENFEKQFKKYLMGLKIVLRNSILESYDR